jgi:hypothetical protein
MASGSGVLELLQRFVQDTHDKLTTTTHGEPEDQLRTPLETFLRRMAELTGHRAEVIGETTLPDRLGRPDFAVEVDDLLTGYVELKAPGTGAIPSRFTGHNKAQWQRFKGLPNILYTDGNEWGLYRDGARQGSVVRLDGDLVPTGRTLRRRRSPDAYSPS